MTQRTALITGAGSGIGESIADAMITAGYAVAVADIATDRADRVAARLAERGPCLPFTADVTAEQDVSQLVAEVSAAFGQIDVLVNNASPATIDKDLHELSVADWHHDLATLHATFLCSRAVLPGMIDRGAGVIVNISSVNGLQYCGNEAYSAAKAGIISLTKSIAVRYGPNGVRANAIAPGTIRTPIWGERIAEDPHVLEQMAGWYPLGRIGEPGDVAALAVFLASPEASWISGGCITVDGALTAGNLSLGKALGAT
jgi:NAD(P)-dependent dehydrogenase (short-subunit alcohol dehydrogenase family)